MDEAKERPLVTEQADVSCADALQGRALFHISLVSSSISSQYTALTFYLYGLLPHTVCVHVSALIIKSSPYLGRHCLLD